jgi:superfamily I DNA and/or RNA helicase
MPPSAIFYEDSLEPYANNGIIAWSGLPNGKLPLIFIGHQNGEETVDEVSLPLIPSSPSIHKVQRATWFNTGEIDRIVTTIKSLLSEEASSSPPLLPAHIGIMAPWREQVWKLRERLRKEKLSAVDVGSSHNIEPIAHPH